MKTRMRRGSKTKVEDPDYWETSKPIKKDGMTALKRNDPVKRDVIYIDFRAEVSAFDKIFHFSKGNLNEKKELLRKRSKYLNRLFNGESMRFPGQPDEKMGKVTELDDESRAIIGNIGEMSLQIGNAVPPKLAQASAKEIIKYMKLFEENTKEDDNRELITIG